MSGRALFTFNPDLFKDADNVADTNKEEAKVDENLFAGEAVPEVDEVDFD